MHITIEVKEGNEAKEPSKKDIQKNIDAVDRAIDGKGCAGDFVSLTDTKSILKGIQRQLPDY